MPTADSFREKKGSVELTLMSLQRQEIDFDDLQVVVVDNGSSDRTPGFLRDVSLGCRLDVVQCPAKGAKALARNVGAAAARGEILVFIDDDVLLPNPRSLRTLVEKCEENTFVCGVERQWTYIGWSRDKIFRELAEGRFSYVRDISRLPFSIDRETGYNALHHVSFLAHFGCLPLSLFDAAEGFDEQYTGWGRHDCDLMFRLIVRHEAKLINAFEVGPIIHLNHNVTDRRKQLDENETRYSDLERAAGVRLRYSHLFGVFEDDDHRVLVPLQEGG